MIFFQATTLQYLVGFGMCVALDGYWQRLTQRGYSHGMFCTTDGVHAVQGLSRNVIEHYNYNRVNFQSSRMVSCLIDLISRLKEV